MALDDDLVQEARATAARLVDCERALDVARADYHHAVRRLHLAGGSMREIAGALDLSHQRVHQIIESVGGSARRWKRHEPKDLCCSFCGAAQKKARRLVAGPGVYICDGCVDAALGVVTEGAATARLDLISTDAEPPCSFCGKQAREGGGIASVRPDASAQAPARRHPLKRKAGGGVAICRQCLDLCQEIRAERGAE